jgi:RNA polymerase sigma factor (sigma-70 family)
LYNLPDIALWQAFKMGDRAAFAELYRRYVKILYNYGSKFSADKALLEDAIQDLFSDLWRMKANLSDTDSVKFYLFRSLRRLIHKQIESESVFSDLNINQNLEAIFAAEPAFEQIQIGKDTEDRLKKRLSQALATLPKRQYEALNLRFYEDFEHPQIADIMGVTEQSARNFVQKALHTLRQNF